jgi:transposase
MNPVYGVVAGIDVHKRMLAVVVAVLKEQEIEYQQRRFGTTYSELEELAQWLHQLQVSEIAMESTAQYWRPVWIALEGQFRLHLAQPRSTLAPRGRKSDFADATRIVRRLVAEDLTLSYVPDREQRQWRTMTRMRVRMSTQQVRLRNQMEGLLEEGRIKLSSVVSDLLGVSGRNILWAMVRGTSDPAQLALLASYKLTTPAAQLLEALRGDLDWGQRLLLKMLLEQWEQLATHIEQLETEMTKALQAWQPATQRLVEIPGISHIAAQQILAEVGPEASAFLAPEKLASWVGVCPGAQESAEVSYSSRSAKGNPMLRRLLTQCAWAAVKVKGSIFEQKFRILLPRLGAKPAIWAIAHWLLRVIWKVLHDKVSYIERGILDVHALERRRKRYVRQLRKLGFAVTLTPLEAQPAT